MGFGVFKKLKEQFKKIKPFIRKVITAVKPVVQAAKPIVQQVLPQKYNKVNDLLSITDEGLDAVDAVVNQNNYDKAIDWTKKNLAPKLKSNW